MPSFRERVPSFRERVPSFREGVPLLQVFLGALAGGQLG